MASCSSSLLLSEEQFMCSICLEVFVQPVTTQCGHNFCKACITKYWDSSALCQCPLCKNIFYKRPVLFINTFISEMAAQFRTSAPAKAASSPDLHPTKPGVSCDFCSGPKSKAVKSCLVCQISYCASHLEPHRRVATLKRHKLIDPVENLEDRMCKKHERPLELFCRTDQTCVCQFCTEGDHRTHDTVPLAQECEERMEKAEAEVKQMIQERVEKVLEIRLSVETSKRDAERKISDSKGVFTTLLRSIQRSLGEIIQVIEEKQKAAEKKAECFIQDLEKEIAELKRSISEMEKRSHTEDHFHLLQSFSSPSTPPHTNDWPEISVHSDLSVVETVWRAVSQMEGTLNTEMEKLPEVKLKRIKQYAVDVTLDPDTANHWLIVSEDGKLVIHGVVRKKLPDDPRRFDDTAVLGKQSFSSGRFYYEVQVEGNKWDLGVVRESINRKGNMSLSPDDGYWAIWVRNGDEYVALDYPPVPLSLKEKPQKVGVFVDYEKGEVSFYDVEARAHIYSFTGCTFTEKLYPYFSPSLDDGDKNSAPLIITPVNL